MKGAINQWDSFGASSRLLLGMLSKRVHVMTAKTARRASRSENPRQSPATPSTRTMLARTLNQDALGAVAVA